MLDSSTPSATDSPGVVPRAMIGRWTVDQYLHLSRWWVVGGAGIIVLTTVVHVLPGTLWPWNAALFFLIGVMVHRQHGGTTESLMAGAIVGLGVGCASAVISLVLDPSVVAVINVIAETLLTGLIAAVIATIGIVLSRLLWRQS